MAERGQPPFYPIDVSDNLFGQRLVRRSGGDDFAPVHDDKMVCEFRRQIEIVQHRKHRTTSPSEIAGDIEDGDLVTDVEACGRFVEKQGARNPTLHGLRQLRQHTGELHALLLTARKPVIGPALEAREIDAVKGASGGDRRFEAAIGNRPHSGHFQSGEGKGKGC